MQTSRRLFLQVATPLAMLAGIPLEIWARQRQQNVPPLQLPTTTVPEISQDDSAKLDPKKVMEADQERMTKDVEKLLKLAQELKDQRDKTDTTSVLPLDMVHKAAEIEKQAKEIESLARQIQKLAVGG
jgi:hypothetical protein